MKKLFEKTIAAIQPFFKDPLFLRKWEQPWYRERQNPNQLSAERTSWRKRKGYTYAANSAHMFVEDMYTGIMPFMVYRGEREKYPVTTEPQISREQQRMLAEGIESDRHAFRLEDALCEFVRNATQSLFIDGVAYYEIIFQRNETGELKSFEFEHIAPFHLFRFFGNYYQIILWPEAKAAGIRVQINKIPAEKIMKIEFPRKYGGKHGLLNVLQRLWELSKELTPKFYMDAMKEEKDVGFLPDEYYKLKYIEIARITKDFGWSQRQQRETHITEYYSMLRFLRHKKVEAIFRKLLIDKLNETLNRQPLNLGVTIKMANLFSVEDVERQEKLLKEGKVKFMDIFNALNV